MTAINYVEIVREWLIRNGYDGLFTPEHDCGCTVDHLAHCGECPWGCEAGFRHPDGGIWRGPMEGPEGS